ncbi:MAG: TetR/AcrR family transcriptional regulator [Cyclobacteriaceae bacterium]
MNASSSSKILDLAEDLFLRLGYGGFSYSHISEQLGVKNAAIHYHFASKGELVKTIIHRIHRRFENWVSELPTDLSAQEKLERTWSVIFEKHLKGAMNVCVVGNSAVSFNLMPQLAQKEVRHMTEGVLDWIESLLSQGRKAGEFGFEGSAKDKAMEIVSATTGSLLLSRISGQNNLEKVKNQLLKEIIIN